MKSLVSVLAIGLFVAAASTASFAAQDNCWPSTGNWVNAATKSCAFKSGMQKASPVVVPEPVECDEEDDEEGEEETPAKS